MQPIQRRLQHGGWQIAAVPAVKHTVPCTRTDADVSGSVGVPTSSIAPSTPDGYSARTSAAAASPTVSDPYAVCNVSGTAPSTDHGKSEENGTTCVLGTTVYSAYPPS